MRLLFHKSMFLLALVSLVLSATHCAKKPAVKSQAEVLRESIASQMGKAWALVIGIEHYAHADSAKFALADAKGVAGLLAEQGFQVRALYDEQATKVAVEAALEEILAKRAGEHDRVVLFFAGRGETKTVAGGRKGFLLPVDAEAGAANETGIGVDRLHELATASLARQVLILLATNVGGIEGRSLDGAAGSSPEATKAVAGARGRQVITAAGSDQRPVDVPEWGHGMFTHYLLAGVGQAKADMNRDGLIPASELYAYLEQNIVVATQIQGRVQRPQFWALSEEAGEVLFLPAQPGGTERAATPDTPGSLAVQEIERDLRALELRVQDLEFLVAQGQPVDEGGLSVTQQLAETRTMAAAVRERYLQARLQAGHEVIGHDGARMVLVPAGEFTMGEGTNQYAVGDPIYVYAPVHKVYLDGFYIDKYEVTAARYAKFIEAEQRPPPRFWHEVNLEVDGERPVIGVSWDDAASYCRWAGKRLPTEAEWEKAARGTDARKYPWGNDEPRQSLANYDWYGIRMWQGYGTLSPVGSYEAGRSPYGAYDMAGSVWEWVADWYDRKYYLVGPKSNPKGPEKGKERVVRSGSWRHPPELMRSAYRHHYQPTVLPFSYLGFRCAQDLPK